jgi:hypothetical protein
MTLELWVVGAFFASVLVYPVVCVLSCVAAHSSCAPAESTALSAHAFDDYTA